MRMSSEVQSPARAVQPQRAPLPPSPCVGICAMDEAHGICSGCGRTVVDIQSWPNLSEKDKSNIWRSLPERLGRLGVHTFRLPASPEEIGVFFDYALASKVGAWEIGLPGLPLRFDAGAARDILTEAAAVTAENMSGDCLRLIKHERVRAFGIADENGNGQWRGVALVLPRGRAVMKQISAPLDAQVLDVDYPFARFMLSCEQNGVQRLRAETMLGTVETAASSQHVTALQKYRFNESAPCAFGIPRAFAVCAILQCEDHDWLAGALAP